MIIGALLNLGVWIRLSALISPDRSYPLLMLGQIFPAIAAPFSLNLTALFAARWFSPQQRDIATAIGSMANPLGAAFGSLLPSLIVTEDVSFRPFFILLAVEAGFTTLTTLLVVVLFRSEPPSPPSSSEEHHQSIDVKQDLRRLLTNRHYLILLFGFSVGMAIFSSMTTVLSQLIKPSDYSSGNAGVFGALIIISGLVSTIIIGIIMDRTHAYRLLLKILLLGACASAFYFIVILRPNMLYPLGVSIGLLGFFLMPLLPISFECAVECTYPVRAEWSTGLLLCIGNMLGAGFTFLLGYLITLAPRYKSGVIFTPASIFIICVYVIAGSVLFMYKGPYLRLEAERTAATNSTVDT
jgi:predicted MFS family arabinose efflux permease